MFLRQLSDPHLAQFSYLIGCQRSGEAMVIDPLRDIARYRDLAAQEDLKITAVAETHIHADYVGGAREFGVADPELRVYVSGAGGPDWQVKWAQELPNSTPLHNGDTFEIGGLEFRVLHVPGHTPEHLVFLLTDRGGGADEPIALFSGDFLLVGAAGRPDLLESITGVQGAREQGAKALYQSLRKVEPLAPHIQVLPAHGAGSSCGKALGSVPTSTTGYEKKFNTTLKLALHGGEREFVDFILRDQPDPPAYFAGVKRLNQQGPPILGGLPAAPELPLEKVLPRLDEPNFVVLDTRDRAAFFAGHLRRSLFTPAAKFTDFAGSFLTPEDEIVLLVADLGQRAEYVRQLINLGFDRIVGSLPASALDAAPAEQKQKTAAVKFPDLPRLLGNSQGGRMFDVRRSAEFAFHHLRGSQNVPHARLRLRLAEVPTDAPLLVSCQSGLRAAGATAFLIRAGHHAICVADHFDHAPKEMLA